MSEYLEDEDRTVLKVDGHTYDLFNDGDDIKVFKDDEKIDELSFYDSPGWGAAWKAFEFWAIQEINKKHKLSFTMEDINT